MVINRKSHAIEKFRRLYCEPKTEKSRVAVVECKVLGFVQVP
jgi:hypothetical protein